MILKILLAAGSIIILSVWNPGIIDKNKVSNFWIQKVTTQGWFYLTATLVLIGINISVIVIDEHNTGKKERIAEATEKDLRNTLIEVKERNNKLDSLVIDINNALKSANMEYNTETNTIINYNSTVNMKTGGIIIENSDNWNIIEPTITQSNRTQLINEVQVAGTLADRKEKAGIESRTVNLGCVINTNGRDHVEYIKSFLRYYGFEPGTVEDVPKQSQQRNPTILVADKNGELFLIIGQFPK